MEEMIRTAIIDDEQHAREGLRLLLSKYRKIDIIGEAKNGSSAMELIRNKEPDLVFMDVEMPGLNGIHILEKVNLSYSIHVIFVTAHSEFALDAFEAGSVDYLLKPFSKERLDKAVCRAFEQIHLKRLKETEAIAKGGENGSDPGSYPKRLKIRKNGKWIFLNVDEIEWIEADNYYVKVHTLTESYLCRDALINMEKALDPGKFSRIHRSHIINLDQIDSMESLSHGNYEVFLKNGKRLKLSDYYRDEVFNRLQIL